MRLREYGRHGLYLLLQLHDLKRALAAVPPIKKTIPETSEVAMEDSPPSRGSERRMPTAAPRSVRVEKRSASILKRRKEGGEGWTDFGVESADAGGGRGGEGVSLDAVVADRSSSEIPLPALQIGLHFFAASQLLESPPQNRPKCRL